MRAKAVVRLLVFCLCWPLTGCAHPPRFIRATPVLRLLYRPATIPYADNPRFSFELPTKWVGPERLPGGVKFREPRGRAAISIVFLARGEPGWKAPEAFRQHMREQGTVEDGHILSRIEISSRTADVARFTGYVYGQEYLLGQKVEVEKTEMVMAADPDGLYVIRYETGRENFIRFHRVLEAFLRSLVLAAPKTLEGNEQ